MQEEKKNEHQRDEHEEKKEAGMPTEAENSNGNSQSEIPNHQSDEKSLAEPSSHELNPQSKSPHLSPEQQLWLNKIFIPNFRRELLKNLKAKDMKPSDRKSKDNKGQKNPAVTAEEGVLDYMVAEKEKEIEEIRSASEKERNNLMGIISEIKIDRELVASAAKQNSVNPAQVAQLLRSSVRLNDEMHPVILDDDGEPAINNEGRAMTIDEKVRMFLEENQHFVRRNSTVFVEPEMPEQVTKYSDKRGPTGGDLILAGLIDEQRKSRSK